MAPNTSAFTLDLLSHLSSTGLFFLPSLFFFLSAPFFVFIEPLLLFTFQSHLICTSLPPKPFSSPPTLPVGCLPAACDADGEPVFSVSLNFSHTPRPDSMLLREWALLSAKGSFAAIRPWNTKWSTRGTFKLSLQHATFSSHTNTLASSHTTPRSHKCYLDTRDVWSSCINTCKHPHHASSIVLFSVWICKPLPFPFWKSLHPALLHCLKYSMKFRTRNHL